MINQFQDLFADEVQRRYLMTKAKGDQLPLGFDDHYLIQGLRDQVEELQEALLSIIGEAGLVAEYEATKVAALFPKEQADEVYNEVYCSIGDRMEAIRKDLLTSLYARSKGIIRILDQLQQKEVKP